MLQRQGWQQHRLVILSPISAHICTSGRVEYRRQIYHCAFRAPVHPSSTLSHSCQIGGILALLPNFRCFYSTQNRATHVEYSQGSRSHETLITTSSQSDGLDGQEQVDRGGRIRDRILLKGTYHGLKRAQTRRGYGPWPGLTVLRPETTKLKQTLHTEHDESCPDLLSEWSPREGLSTRLRFPWISELSRQNSGASLQSAHTRLNDELGACQKYFEPTSLETAAATDAWVDLKAIIQEGTGPNARINLIGSRASGTNSPLSDLDINVQFLTEPDAMNSSNYTKQQLRHLDRHLRKPRYRHRIARDLYLRKAYVPIVSGTHIPSGLEFQIQSNIVAYDSLEVARAFVAEFPSACTLFKIVKQMLSMRGLTRAQTGGVTSYPLLNMVVASLKLADSRIETNDLATQLLHFLNFWSDFDYSRSKIALVHSPPLTDGVHPHINYAIDPISAIPRVVLKDVKRGTIATLLSIEDPADPSNDLGRNTYGIKRVQAYFNQARRRLRHSMQEWDASSNTTSDLGRPEPLLAWCLGGDYTTFEEARWQLYKHGKRVAEHRV